MQIVEAHGDSVISDFGVVLDSAGNYQFLQTDETLNCGLLQMFMERKQLMNFQTRRNSSLRKM